jgi:hypothetical protein
MVDQDDENEFEEYDYGDEAPTEHPVREFISFTLVILVILGCFWWLVWKLFWWFTGVL